MELATTDRQSCIQVLQKLKHPKIPKKTTPNVIFKSYHASPNRTLNLQNCAQTRTPPKTSNGHRSLSNARIFRFGIRQSWLTPKISCSPITKPHTIGRQAVESRQYTPRYVRQVPGTRSTIKLERGFVYIESTVPVFWPGGAPGKARTPLFSTL